MTSAGETRIASNRRLDLEGALNFRDLGGYTTPHGTTASGKVFRSDALSTLTEQDIARLLDLGLSTVVDLRDPSELEASPGVFANHARVRYRHNPVATLGPTDVAPHERLLALDFAVHNVEMLRYSGETFAVLFHLLADVDNCPLVFHCHGGRDRTGVAAALVLSAAGVSRQDIVEDYLISNEYLVPLMQRMSAAYASKGIDPEPILANLHLREAYLTALLDALEQEFQGIDAYLQSIGVTRPELEAFRGWFMV
jgi:protein-tyrosine phosphatase